MSSRTCAKAALAVAAIETRDFALRLAVGRTLLQVGALVVRDLTGRDADLRLQLPFFQ
jgi:hypothetical protein